jgi:hypothetical protein
VVLDEAHTSASLVSLSRVWVAAARGYVCHPSASFSVRARGATRRRGGERATELQILFVPQFRFSERGRVNEKWLLNSLIFTREKVVTKLNISILWLFSSIDMPDVEYELT